MDISNSNEMKTKLCQMCRIQPQKYTCPRCSIPYCSTECYKSTLHLDCSEDFYKECVENEMKSQTNDPEDRKKMIDILKKFHTESSFDTYNYDDTDEDELNDQNTSHEAIDSDDDNEVPDLSERIRNVDLNNADDLWTVLTDSEKQEFEAIIRNGDVESILPSWIPWWSKPFKNKLVHIIDDNEDTDYKKNCPNVIHITSINVLEKASPLICYNLLNVLMAYALMVLHYNGEHESSPIEAAAFFLRINDVIGGVEVFKDAPSAITSVLRKAIEYELIPEYNEHMTILDSVKKIIQGPCKEHQTYYMAAALSDLHQLFNEVIKSHCDTNKRAINSTFPKKFHKDIQSRYLNLSKKHWHLYLKKIEYFLAWNEKNGKLMCDLNLNCLNNFKDIHLE